MRYLAACDRFFDDAPGGAYRIAWDVARLLRGRGHDVALLCGSTERDPAPGASVIEGITVVRYRFPTTWRANPARWRMHIAGARSMAARLLSGSRWDVVHAHTPASGTAAWLACGRGARLVYTVHSPVALEQRVNWRGGGLAGMVKLLLGTPVVMRAERKLVRAADQVHVLSSYTRRLVGAMHGDEVMARVVQIPWWATLPSVHVRDDARASLKWPGRAPVFFTLRRLVRRMGLDTLIGAASRIARHFEFHIAIGGDGPERDRLHRLAKAAGLAGRITFHGRMSDLDVARAYSGCDVFVLPTRELECFGIIALEAMAYGRPVLGSDAGAIPELLVPVLPGWVFPAGDEEALASKMAAVLDGTLVRPSPDALIRYVADHFDPTMIAARYASLLEGAAEAV
jgi:glycosyltransferase involved in cell wall biosynthesis